MATCILEDIQYVSLVMQQPSLCETTNDHCHATCSQWEPTMAVHQDSLRKRSLNRSHTYHGSAESTTNNSCALQAVSRHPNESTMTKDPRRLEFPYERNVSVLSSRPSTLLVPLYRSFLSHPATLSDPLFPIDDDDHSLSSLKFTSVSELLSPPLKRLRSQNSIDVPVAPAIQLISPSDLADKLQGTWSLTLFDCGSPIRYSKHRMQNSILLPVSDKISRKRFKTNRGKETILRATQLNQCDMIILYDDDESRPIAQPEERLENDLRLSVGIKCVCEEIQQCLTDRHPPILVLNGPFKRFVDLYPNLCESLQYHSSPSSPIHGLDDASSVSVLQLPHTAPILPSLFNDHQLQTFPMTHIHSGLYIGSEFNARNLHELASEQIQYIVSIFSSS